MCIKQSVLSVINCITTYSQGDYKFFFVMSNPVMTDIKLSFFIWHNFQAKRDLLVEVYTLLKH